MSKLAFLQNIQVVADERPKKPRTKEWNPTEGLAIRLWKSGEVYPSQALVDQFNLEFKNRLTDEDLTAIKAGTISKPHPGNGFDVIDTEDFPAFKSSQRLLIISPVPKDQLKVDLFGTVSYSETMTPVISVMDQGAATFGKDFLIPTLKEVYDIELGDENPYVDLVFMGKEGTDNPEPFFADKDIVFFPKKVARGEKKGEMTIQRREKPAMYVLYPKQLLEEPETQTAAVADPAI